LKNLNKKGFTLIEVVATVAIASLVMVALVSFFSVISKVFVTSAVESELRLISSSTKAYLKNELTYVTEIGGSGDGTYNKIEFTGGRIFKNDIQVFDNEFYGNTSIDGEITGQGSVLTITLKVKKGVTERSEVYVIKTLNKVDTAISTPVKVIYYK
jgi:prepilin-type N-terminal cleavage/methylation domain-containing protein